MGQYANVAAVSRRARRPRIEVLESRQLLAVVPFGPAVPIITPVIDQPGKISLTDLDGDDRLDLLVQQTRPPGDNVFARGQHVLMSYRQTDNGYESAVVEVDVLDHVLQDFNNDGQNDLLVLGPLSAYLQMGQADGTFKSASIAAVRDERATNRFFRVASIGVADMDLDGDVDVTMVVSDRPGTRGKFFAWLENDGNAGFGELNRVLPMFGSRGVATGGDFDGDGDVDLIAENADVSSRGFAWFENVDDQYEYRPLPGLSHLGSGSEIRVRDVTGDGLVDAVVVERGSTFSTTDENVFVFRYDSATNQMIEDPAFAFGKGATNVVFYDTDGDDDLDAVRYTERIVEHFERTTNGFLRRSELLTSKGDIAGLTVDVMAPGGELDLAVAQQVPGRLEIIKEAFRPTAESSVISRNLMDGVSAVLTADFDGDLVNDLLLPGVSLDWLPGPITDEMRTSVHSIVDLQMQVTEVVDVDRDGDPDILASTSDELIWFENEQATFQRHILGPGVNDIAVMDVDNDRRMDLITSDGLTMNLMRYEYQDDTRMFSPPSVAIDMTGIQVSTPPGFPNPFTGSLAADAFVAELAPDVAADRGDRLAVSYCEDRCEARGLMYVEWTRNEAVMPQLLARINDDDLAVGMTFGDFVGNENSELLYELSDEGASVYMYSFSQDGGIEVSRVFRCGECEVSRPTAVDMDLDGDLDVWHPGRRIWLENQGGERPDFAFRFVSIRALERGSIISLAELDGLTFTELVVASGNVLKVIRNQVAELDFNTDGLFNVGDLDLLGAAISRHDSDAKYDVDGNGMVNRTDLDVAVYERAGARIGDVNLDTVVDSSDLVLLFQAGRYERDVDAFWSEGDFDLDGRFTSNDLVEMLSAYFDDDD